MPRRQVLTKARKRFVSSLVKNLIVVVVAAAFGGEYVFRLEGAARAWFVVAVSIVVLTLFVVGLWLAVDNGDE